MIALSIIAYLLMGLTVYLVWMKMEQGSCPGFGLLCLGFWPLILVILLTLFLEDGMRWLAKKLIQ